MIRLLLGTVIIAMMALPAEAEERIVPPPVSLFQLKPTNFDRQSPRDKEIVLQLQLRRQEYLDRDRSQFDQSGQRTFSSPANRPYEERGNPKFRLGVVYRF